MANILLGFNDKASGSTLSDGSWSNLNNLKSTNFGLQAVSTDAQAANTRFRLDLGANYVIRALALANCSMTKNALWRVRLGQAPMDMDFATGVGDTRLTASGGTNGTVFNEAGLMVAASTSPRFDYDRLSYWNGFLQSADISQVSAWAVSNARVLDASTVAFGTGTGTLGQGSLNVVSGATYVITAKVRIAAGTEGDFRFALFNGTSVQYSSTKLTATSKWKRFRGSIVASATSYGSGSAALHRGATAAGDPSPTTSATFQVKDMQVQTVPADRGELPYRATTTTRIYRCLGILREEARTNLLLRSSEIDNVTWSKGSSAVTANQAVGPDGAVSMDFLKENGAAGAHSASQTGVTYSTTSFYYLGAIAKRAVGTRDIQLEMSLTAGGFASVIISLSTGATSSLGTGGTNPWTNLMAGAVPIGDGLFWCWLVGKTGATAGAGTAIFRLINGGTNSYTGDNASGIYIGCADLQAGAFPTSHIPTTAATVTRAADSVAATAANFSSWFTSATAGTLYAEISRRFDSPDTTVAPVAVAISDGTASNRVILFSTTATDSTDAVVTSGGALQASLTVASALTYGTTAARVALGYQVGDFALCANGGTVTSSASGNVPGGLNQLEVGSGPSSTALNGHVRRFTYWPNRLADAELQALTASGPGAVDYDSGWAQARQMEFTDDEVPTNWAAQYNPLQAFAAKLLRYGTVEFLDSAALSLGRLFVSGGFQPDTNASYGLKDGRVDLSTSVKALSGKKYSTARRRLRTAEFALDWLSQTESDTLAELHALIGTTDEVLYVPDPDDIAFSQRYGGIGTLSELSPIDFPHPLVRATAVRWEEKL